MVKFVESTDGSGEFLSYTETIDDVRAELAEMPGILVGSGLTEKDLVGKVWIVVNDRFFVRDLANSDVLIDTEPALYEQGSPENLKCKLAKIDSLLEKLTELDLTKKKLDAASGVLDALDELSEHDAVLSLDALEAVKVLAGMRWKMQLGTCSYMCMRCEGTGRVQMTDLVPYGPGWITLGMLEVCPKCVGAGKCPKCGGLLGYSAGDEYTPDDEMCMSCLERVGC